MTPQEIMSLPREQAIALLMQQFGGGVGLGQTDLALPGQSQLDPMNAQAQVAPTNVQYYAQDPTLAAWQGIGDWALSEGRHAGQTSASQGYLRPIYDTHGDYSGNQALLRYEADLTPSFRDEGGYGRYVGEFNPDGSLKDVRYNTTQLSGGFIGDNIDTIGPLLVAAVAPYAFGAVANSIGATTAAAQAGGWNAAQSGLDYGWGSAVPSGPVPISASLPTTVNPEVTAVQAPSAVQTPIDYSLSQGQSLGLQAPGGVPGGPLGAVDYGLAPGMTSGTGLQAPAYSGLPGAGAGMVPVDYGLAAGLANPNLALMGGAQGLTTGAAQGLSGMGGGQGLVVPGLNPTVTPDAFWSVPEWTVTPTGSTPASITSSTPTTVNPAPAQTPATWWDSIQNFGKAIAPVASAAGKVASIAAPLLAIQQGNKLLGQLDDVADGQQAPNLNFDLGAPAGPSTQQQQQAQTGTVAGVLPGRADIANAAASQFLQPGSRPLLELLELNRRENASATDLTGGRARGPRVAGNTLLGL